MYMVSLRHAGPPPTRGSKTQCCGDGLLPTLLERHAQSLSHTLVLQFKISPGRNMLFRLACGNVIFFSARRLTVFLYGESFVEVLCTVLVLRMVNRK